MTDWPLTPEAAAKLFRLDAETGEIYFCERSREWFESDQSCGTWNTRFAGQRAFTSYDSGKDSYTGRVLNRTMRKAVMAYCLTFGEWPSHRVGFHNGDQNDTRPANLFDKQPTRNRGKK